VAARFRYHAEQEASMARSARFSFGRRGSRRCKTSPLTRREIDVLKHMATGKTNVASPLAWSFQ
jgi:hypothetical protein